MIEHRVDGISYVINIVLVLIAKKDDRAALGCVHHQQCAVVEYRSIMHVAEQLIAFHLSLTEAGLPGWVLGGHYLTCGTWSDEAKIPDAIRPSEEVIEGQAHPAGYWGDGRILLMVRVEGLRDQGFSIGGVDDRVADACFGKLPLHEELLEAHAAYFFDHSSAQKYIVIAVGVVGAGHRIKMLQRMEFFPVVRIAVHDIPIGFLQSACVVQQIIDRHRRSPGRKVGEKLRQGVGQGEFSVLSQDQQTYGIELFGDGADVEPVRKREGYQLRAVRIAERSPQDDLPMIGHEDISVEQTRLMGLVQICTQFSDGGLLRA